MTAIKINNNPSHIKNVDTDLQSKKNLAEYRSSITEKMQVMRNSYHPLTKHGNAFVGNNPSDRHLSPKMMRGSSSTTEINKTVQFAALNNPLNRLGTPFQGIPATVSPSRAGSIAINSPN